MRPPEFTGGNDGPGGVSESVVRRASMRPPEFTGGNPAATGRRGRPDGGFNEAAGIHRRKLDQRCSVGRCGGRHASMRPPEFTGGNSSVSPTN